MPDRIERAKPREQRLVQVRGAGGSTRMIETRRSDEPALARAEGDDPGFEGYASTFWLVDSYGTAVAPGAFTKTLQERAKAIMVLWQHNPDWPIGRSLLAVQDDFGLSVRARVSDTMLGRDTMTLLRDEVPLGLSIGFRTIRERPATPEDPLRFGFNTPEWVKRDPTNAYVLQELALWEYSPVTFEANHEAAPTVIHAESLDGIVAAQLLEDLRAGRLDAAGRALVAEIAAAWQAAPDDLAIAPRTEAEARRDRELALKTIAAARGLTVEQLTCAA